MPLDWDVLLDDVSIKDQIAGFSIRETKGAYARELTLLAVDPAFYDQFDYTITPVLRIEVKTKTDTAWISQGKFYIERNNISVNHDSILSPGVWGRSQTAKAGMPFAQKISKTWDENTTCQDIMTQMADLCSLSITFEIDDYTVFANSYAVDGVYPIDVISELAGFYGAYIGCTPGGALVVKQEIFHPSSSDYTITDNDISELTENLEYPEFGNRIRISAIGAGAGYQVALEALEDDDCLPADGSSKGVLLAFVTDNKGEPVTDNTIVSWAVENGAALENANTNTGNYFLENRKHTALNYYTVNVDFPIIDVIGVFAYGDASGRHNFFNKHTCSFEGRTITIDSGFSFCDQTLRVTYITGGCAVNRVIAGNIAKDVEVTADVEGASDTLTIKMGNTCACGSSLNAKINPYGSICIGKQAHILVWATINNQPATGYRVKLRKISGCGQLSSENKKLKTAKIINEASYARNTVIGVSQVETEIIPADNENPAVYLKSDTGKSNNLYLSHDGNLIDLTTVQATGTEVVIDYYADGATLVAWRTLGVTKDCDATIVAKMADGTEAGLREEINVSAKDCTVPEDIPEHDEDVSEDDPDEDDQDSPDHGFDDDNDDEEPVDQTACEAAAEEREATIDGATYERKRDESRFSVYSSSDCPEEGEDFGCSCSDMCASEIEMHGGVLDHSETIHETVEDSHRKGTPEYNEAFEVLKQEHQATCEQNCANTRESVCGNCEIVSGPEVLAPGESAEYVCEDGVTGIFTMPEGACGSHTFTIGCCAFDVRSTSGQWVAIISNAYTQSGNCGSWWGCDSGEVIKGKYKERYTKSCVHGCDPNEPLCAECQVNNISDVPMFADCDTNTPDGTCPDKGYGVSTELKGEFNSYRLWEWQCL